MNHVQISLFFISWWEHMIGVNSTSLGADDIQQIFIIKDTYII